MAMPGVNSPVVENGHVDKIFKLVEKETDVNRYKIRSRLQDDETCIARHLVIYLLKKTTKYSNDRIGSYVCRSGWTVPQSINVVNNYLEYDGWWKSIVAYILKEL